MKLFDFFKRKKADRPVPSDTQAHAEEECVLYETKLTAREVTTDSRLIRAVVDEMVAEDPFKKFYERRFPSSRRVYEYESITTMNVSVDPGENNRLFLTVEGIGLGEIPPARAREMEPYREKHVLTAYAFVTGGRYREFAEETEDVQEGTEPYDLDIFLQFT